MVKKCWHFSDHTNFIPSCSSGALYKGKDRYIVNKLDLLATTSGSRLPIQHSHTELKAVKCALSYWLAALQHISCIFDGNGASLQCQPTSLKRLFVVFLALTQLRYRYTIVAWPFSMQQVGCLCLLSHLYTASIITQHSQYPSCSAVMNPSLCKPIKRYFLTLGWRWRNFRTGCWKMQNNAKQQNTETTK